jgi:hypothetical membrane protein
MSGHATAGETGEWTVERAALVAGPAAVAVSALGIFGSAVLASWVWGSWFGWTTHALSDLGHVKEPTAPLFNGGLIVAGVLGVAFCWRVWRAATNAWHRLGAALMALGLVNSALVGVFPLPKDLHGVVALAYFVLFTLGLFAHGSGDALTDGRAARGVRSIWYGVAHVAAWVLLGLVPFDGIALPELVGALGLWAWTVQLYLDMRA